MQSSTFILFIFAENLYSVQGFSYGLALESVSSRRVSCHQLLRAIEHDGDGESDDDDISSGNVADNSDDPIPAKPTSRLALLAEDWEEEDELQSYWDRYDSAKSKSSDTSSSSSSSSSKPVDKIDNIDGAPPEYEIDPNISTTERLDRYFESRGINKSTEKKYQKDIQNAITYATSSASNANDAMTALKKVRPYMQVGSKLGGTALLELAYAHQAAAAAAGDGIDNDDGELLYNEKQYIELCNIILEQNPLREVRIRAKQLLDDPKRYGKNYNEKRTFWESFDAWWS